jgi:hypothetical protein
VSKVAVPQLHLSYLNGLEVDTLAVNGSKSPPVAL